jgi:mono/diheme cytochrome c family protein
MMVLALALLAQSAIPAPGPIAGARTPRQNWEERCIACHGEDGKAATKKGRELKAKDFTRPKWQKHTTDQEIVEAITNGIPKKKMPAFKDKLSGEEIQALVPFLRAFGNK